MSHIYFCTFATRVNCVPTAPSTADEARASVSLKSIISKRDVLLKSLLYVALNRWKSCCELLWRKGEIANTNFSYTNISVPVGGVGGRRGGERRSSFKSKWKREEKVPVHPEGRGNLSFFFNYPRKTHVTHETHKSKDISGARRLCVTFAREGETEKKEEKLHSSRAQVMLFNE